MKGIYGRTVVGWTEGCSTTVVQQLGMPDRREECRYVEQQTYQMSI